ncbi:MAG: putative membrane protein [bacterium P3]|nr:MAG: putative membrane protein [bacterium P3]KWW40432.1 MAG: putative membrane protein [bacterium F083]
MKITFRSDSGFFMGPWGFLARVVVMSLAAVLAGYLLPGIWFDSMATVIVTAVVISLLNNFIRPILIVVTLPFTLFSMGLFLLVVNAVIILLAAALVPRFHVDGFGSAFWFSLLLTLFNYLLELPNKVIRHRRRYRSPHEDDDTGFTPYEEVE